MLALFRKEISSFFSSIIGYIVIIIFLLITSLFLWVFPIESNILDYGYAQINGLFLIAPYVFLFLVPAISMRSFADENKSGTIELLLTKPISDFQIILAKFGAAFVLLIIAILPTLIYYISVYQLGYPAGNIDSGGVFGSYIGLLFLGAAFISIGLFASSITSNQIVAFIVSIVLSGFIFIGFEFIFSLEIFGNASLIIKTLGIYDHYSSISRGVLDTRDIIYFISLISLFLFLTRFSLQSRKW
ncbi:MAG: gliding motility-associated ABC transporter permease subunit GldF [Bacteroidetes bacterium 4572_112]|nr:MAG: gliding motility-associated ABC transporter permease subunit GldF [Bacteroidetes bacterium 4572_112]